MLECTPAPVSPSSLFRLCCIFMLLGLLKNPGYTFLVESAPTLTFCPFFPPEIFEFKSYPSWETLPGSSNLALYPLQTWMYIKSILHTQGEFVYIINLWLSKIRFIWGHVSMLLSGGFAEGLSWNMHLFIHLFSLQGLAWEGSETKKLSSKVWRLVVRKDPWGGLANPL